MNKLDRATVERWQAYQETRQKPKAFPTLKRSYDALHALLVHATDRKVIERNPLEGIKLQKPALSEDELADKTQRRYLEDTEVKALSSGLDKYQDLKRSQRRSSREHGKDYLPSLDNLTYVDHVKPFILVLYYTGFRPGDLFGLRWEQVNFELGTIRKVIEKTAHHTQEPMTFPLCSSVISVLKAWHYQQDSPTAGHVFPSPRTGKRLDISAMRQPWKTVRKLSELPDDLLLYSLRHNFASQLVMSGTDLLTVSKLMAHTDIQTTIKYYAHLRPDHTRDAVEAFGNRGKML
jgi:integrase